MPVILTFCLQKSSGAKRFFWRKPARKHPEHTGKTANTQQTATKGQKTYPTADSMRLPEAVSEFHAVNRSHTPPSIRLLPVSRTRHWPARHLPARHGCRLPVSRAEVGSPLMVSTKLAAPHCVSSQQPLLAGLHGSPSLAFQRFAVGPVAVFPFIFGRSSSGPSSPRAPSAS